MKKLLFALQLIVVSATAQITLETAYATPNPYFSSGIIQLTSSGYKYLIRDSNDIVLYNLNHSVFRTFSIPTLPTIASQISVRYVSEELFNTNPADIEYMVYYTDTIGPFTGVPHITVFDELGNILFDRDSAVISNSEFSPVQASQGIVATPSGAKMLLHLAYFTELEIYSLPGILPCQECIGGVISGIAQSPAIDNNQQQLPNPYPNPTNNTTTIPYELPAGVNTGTMIIYDLLGNEVRRYEVGRAFNTLEIAVGELAQGTYTYSLVTTEGVLRGNKFVVSE